MQRQTRDRGRVEIAASCIRRLQGGPSSEIYKYEDMVQDYWIEDAESNSTKVQFDHIVDEERETDQIESEKILTTLN